MSIINDLEVVLDEEQRLLLSGDFEALSKLATRKSELAEKLKNFQPDEQVGNVSALMDKAKHNEALLNSARRGLQSAMAQLKMASQGENHSTYSREGERTPLTRPKSVTQKL